MDEFDKWWSNLMISIDPDSVNPWDEMTKSIARLAWIAGHRSGHGSGYWIGWDDGLKTKRSDETLREKSDE